jgi:hypothetical protein
MPPGAGWCQKCYVFWCAWWLRYTRDSCNCVDCLIRRMLQPQVDRDEKHRALRVWQYLHEPHG